MKNRGSGTKSFRISIALLAAALIAAASGGVQAQSDLDWLLYRPDTDYLNYPSRQPGYREPGDAPYVPEPLPAPPAPGNLYLGDEESLPRQSLPRWRRGVLACEVVRQRIAAKGYSRVRAIDCAGDFYGYTAVRGKARFRVSARARDGQVVSQTPLTD